jgi:putative serine protease PepD
LVSAGVAFGTVQLTGNTTTKTVMVPASSEAKPVSPATATTVPAGSTLSKNPKEGLELHALIAKVQPSVVAVEVSQKNSDGAMQPISAGSGVIISSDGLVLTNAHVVAAQDQFGRTIDNVVFTLKMNDGTVREAKVLGTAPDFDVAVMRLTDTSNLTPITLGNSAEVRVGDDVVAIGNALDLGDSPTITRGIVSALDRSLEETSTVTLHGLIQTDAPINHGNSGGALVDAQGHLIGINSAGIPDAQNIGFAIAIDTIKPLLDDLKAGKTPTSTPTAFLGVSVSQTPSGVAIVSVTEGSGASKAGIEAGDIIKKVGDSNISTIEQLGEVLRTITPGTNTAVQVLRDGKSLDVSVQMGARTD